MSYKVTFYSHTSMKSPKMEMKGNDMATNIHINIVNMVQPLCYTNAENNEPMRQQIKRHMTIQQTNT